jgi:hypothetical protein
MSTEKENRPPSPGKSARRDLAGHFGARIVPIRSLQLVAAYGSESA